MPSASDVVETDQFPDASASAPPIVDAADVDVLAYTCTEMFGSACPSSATLWYDVMLSPTTPVSLYDANAGVDGADGATVSTENLNGVIVFAAFGASSLPVNVCDPLASALEVRIHTLAYMSEPNVPIATPSTNTLYDDRPPSPINQNVGVALELAVLFEPICKFVPHVPLSSCARFVVHADAPPATNANNANTTTTTPLNPTTQRRENLLIVPPHSRLARPNRPMPSAMDSWCLNRKARAKS